MSLAVVILAAGQGTRLKSSLPKVLHRLGGATPLMVFALDEPPLSSRMCLTLADSQPLTGQTSRPARPTIKETKCRLRL